MYLLRGKEIHKEDGWFLGRSDRCLFVLFCLMRYTTGRFCFPFFYEGSVCRLISSFFALSPNGVFFLNEGFVS